MQHCVGDLKNQESHKLFYTDKNVGMDHGSRLCLNGCLVLLPSCDTQEIWRHVGMHYTLAYFMEEKTVTPAGAAAADQQQQEQ